MSQAKFVARVTAAISQGAVAAFVGAALGAIAEPIVNRVLTERITVDEALKSFNWDKAIKTFLTATLPTNLIKFPVRSSLANTQPPFPPPPPHKHIQIYEMINVLLSKISLPESGKGAITGAIFTTLTLPLGNYRFYKTMGIPINPASLYKAYTPTVLRDVAYGMARNSVGAAIAGSFSNSAAGKFFHMFFTALAACVISSPFNELRGYTFHLQNSKKDGKEPKPFLEFFNPQNYVRSTGVGATNLGKNKTTLTHETTRPSAVSLATGTLIVDPVKAFLARLRETASPATLVALFLAVAYGLSKVNGKRNKTRKQLEEPVVEETEPEQTTSE